MSHVIVYSSDTRFFQNKTSAVLLLAQIQFQEQVPYLGEFLQPVSLLSVPAHSHHTCSPFAMILQDAMCHLASRTPPTGVFSSPPSNNLLHSNCPPRKPALSSQPCKHLEHDVMHEVIFCAQVLRFMCCVSTVCACLDTLWL